MTKITVIIPTLNEAQGIGPTIQEIKRELRDPFILVIDANSLDGTADIASALGARVVKQLGRGKGRAFAEALPYVPKETKWLVWIDGDYSYPATYIPEMIRVLEQKPNFAMICGNTKRREKTFWPHVKRLLTDRFYLVDRLFILLHHVLNGVDVQDPFSGLRLLRYECIKDFHPKSKGFDIELEMNHYIVKTRKLGIIELPISLRKRLGKIKYGYINAFELLRRMMVMAVEDAMARLFHVRKVLQL